MGEFERVGEKKKLSFCCSDTEIVSTSEPKILITSNYPNLRITVFDNSGFIITGSIIYHYHLQWTIIEGDGINHRTGIIETVVIDSDDRYDGFQRCLIRLCLYS